MLKGINKCIEKENGHKHRGFYSECCDADESQNAPGEQSWGRVALDKGAHTVAGLGQEDLGAIYLHGSYCISNIAVFFCFYRGSAFRPQWSKSTTPPTPRFFFFF